MFKLKYLSTLTYYIKTWENSKSIKYALLFCQLSAVAVERSRKWEWKAKDRKHPHTPRSPIFCRKWEWKAKDQKHPHTPGSPIFDRISGKPLVWPVTQHALLMAATTSPSATSSATIIIKVIINKMVRMMIININIVLMNLIVIIIDNVCVRNADDNMSDKCG